MAEIETKMAIIDGREALGYVVIRRGVGDTLIPEVGMNGITRKGMATVLRHMADRLTQMDLEDAIRAIPGGTTTTGDQT